MDSNLKNEQANFKIHEYPQNKGFEEADLLYMNLI